MAECSVKQITVTKPVIEDQFILKLTEDEAKELMASLGILSSSYTGEDGPRTSLVHAKLSDLFRSRGYGYGQRRSVRLSGNRVLWDSGVTVPTRNPED